jgi:hypothetical protein
LIVVVVIVVFVARIGIRIRIRIRIISDDHMHGDLYALACALVGGLDLEVIQVLVAQHFACPPRRWILELPQQCEC